MKEFKEERLKYFLKFKMKRAILRDIPAGKVHDLTALVEKHGAVSIGRAGNDALIELGKDILIERETEAIVIAKLKALHNLASVSKEHATISYGFNGDSYGFFIKDHSRNGTWINNDKISGEKGRLRHGDVLRFGLYDSAVFEYEEVSE